jgi:hypothetical protein
MQVKIIVESALGCLTVKFDKKINVAGLHKIAPRCRAKHIQSFDVVLLAQIYQRFTVFVN